jgi:hypothetical protein
METPQASVKKIALNYGLILALASILIQVISYVTNNHIDQPWWITVASTIISVAIYVYALKAFRKDNGGFMSLGQALKVGLAAAVISGIIYAVYFYLFTTVIEPDFMQQTLEFRNEQMLEQNPNMTQEQVDAATEMQQMFMQPWLMSAFVIIGSLFWGFIISLVAGLILKRSQPGS